MDLRDLREAIEASWRADRPIWREDHVTVPTEYTRVVFRSQEAASLAHYLLRHSEELMSLLDELELLRRFRDECAHRGAYR